MSRTRQPAVGVLNVNATIGLKAFAAFALSLPLLADVTRKYLLHSHYVLVIADIFAAILAVMLFAVRPYRYSAILILAAIGLMALGLFSVIVGHQNLLLAAVGVRVLVVPICYLLISIYVVRGIGAAEAAKLLYAIATFWLVVLGIVAFLQLLLGREHWINILPGNVGADEMMGIGDYTAGESGLEELFRPTSIFLHSGKFGQVAFVLATYRLFYRTASRVFGMRWLFGTTAELVVLLVSGQRVAVILFMVATVAIVVTNASKIARCLSLAALILAIVAISSLIEREDSSNVTVGHLILTRVLSSFGDIPIRLVDNIVEPFEYIVDRWGVVGAGVGAFSLGSTRWGGKALYDAVPVGIAENSWLRILAEQGSIGLAWHAFFWIGLIVAPWLALARLNRQGLELDSNERTARMMLRFVSFQLLALLIWANTHDVLGNVTVMSLSLGTAGFIAMRRRGFFSSQGLSAVTSRASPR